MVSREGARVVLPWAGGSEPKDIPPNAASGFEKKMQYTAKVQNYNKRKAEYELKLERERAQESSEASGSVQNAQERSAASGIKRERQDDGEGQQEEVASRTRTTTMLGGT